ncbi:hypothetical protein CDD82_784 [Ophiocordyceps australis]|uniref:Biotrophy-associated secreted protein 2 n=1 Tax=Ophiocordyceps australis TaxID=1399860 RepID=A0A2C5ZK55_9HYPO|nr:hypothetical protein CDD82_784 [Ophiocordyceps australis]
MVRIYAFATLFALALTVSAEEPGQANIGNGAGKQFITGSCLSDADCASGCCATKAGKGVCSAKLVANEDGKEGCGFGGSSAGGNNGGAGNNGKTGGRGNRSAKNRTNNNGATQGQTQVLGQIDANGQCVCNAS